MPHLGGDQLGPRGGSLHARPPCPLHHGPSRERGATPIAETDLIVTTYALLRRDVEALAAVPFRCVVLDEAQNIKNADSATTRAAGRLDASMRLALSGTPIENRLRELWSLASFANPGMLGTARAFETRFERPIAADRASPIAAELRAVVRPFLLRRTKDDVLRELPPKTEIDRVVTLTPGGQAHVRRAGARAARQRGAGRREARRARARSASSRRSCACGRWRATRAWWTPRLGRQGAQSAKREAFLDLVRELVAEGRRALVFSQFVQLLTLWRRDLDAEGIAYEYLDGKTTKRDEVGDALPGREGAALSHLAQGRRRGAEPHRRRHRHPLRSRGGTRRSRTRRPIARYRIGQDKPVTVVRLIARGTIEEKILSLKARSASSPARSSATTHARWRGSPKRTCARSSGDAEAAEADDEEEPEPRSPADLLATAGRVLDPDFDALVVEVRWWLATTGRAATDIASIAEVPPTFAARLAHGKPFPCSRAVADRIRARLRAW